MKTLPVSDKDVVWVDIVGYEGLYMISSNAKVWNIIRGQLAKNQLNANKYERVKLRRDNSIKYFFVHRLIMLSFNVPNPEKKATVNHKDGDKSNNDITNLEWMTRTENMNHAYENGLAPRILTKVIASEIRTEYEKGGTSYRILGKKHGVSFGTIREIIKGSIYI